MKSKSAAIYVVDTHSDLSKWHSEGLFSDFLNDTGLSSLTTKIPAGIQLNRNGIGSYGIPLMLEGYGYIFDKNMLSDIFGAEKKKKNQSSCFFSICHLITSKMTHSLFPEYLMAAHDLYKHLKNS